MHRIVILTSILAYHQPLLHHHTRSNESAVTRTLGKNRTERSGKGQSMRMRSLSLSMDSGTSFLRLILMSLRWF